MRRKIRRMGQCIISVLLVCALVICNVTYVQAKKISKQESVYVNAGADGSVSKITVADRLMGADRVSGKIADISDLANIINVKGDETYDQDGDQVSWTGSGSDIYYQGESDKELPVDVQITYTLDGEEMTAEEMLGLSGELVMHVTYTNHSATRTKIDGKEVTIYTPFVMITGMMLPLDQYEHVEIDNGRVLDDGDNSIVIGIGLPGLAESLGIEDSSDCEIPSDFTVTADVTDFSIGNTITYGSASFFNELDLDEVDDLDDLEDQLTKLGDSSDKLAEGATELAKNMNLFSDQTGNLKEALEEFKKDGIDQLASGIQSLGKGAKTFANGINQYVSGVASFAKGTTSYVEGAKKITDGCSTLYKSIKGLPAQIQTFDTGLQSYTSAVDQMGTQENVTTLKNGAKAVSDGVSTINSKLIELEESYQTTDALIAELEASGADATTVATLKTVLSQQKAAIQALKESTSKDSSLQTGADSVSTGVDTVMDGLSTLSSKSSTLTDASTQLNENVPTIVSSVKELKEGGETLSSNNKKLKKSSKKLVSSGKKIKKNAKKVKKGTKSLNEGAKSLKKASGKINSATKKIDTAAGKLSDGADTLSDGMDSFDKQGIDKITSLYEDDIQVFIDRLNAICDAGSAYNNFSGISDTMDGDVKFVIETDAVEKED